MATKNLNYIHMKNVLVTGANGLLGQKLVEMLLPFANQYQIIATARGENRAKITKGYIYEPLDITNVDAVSAIFEKYQPDAVIHGAAMTNVDQCEDQKELCWDANVNAVLYIVNECKKYNSRLIHVSTDFIFDGKNGPYTENAEANPLSYYGESKLAAEKLVQNSGLHWAIARTVLVYGVINDPSRSNIVLWAKNALESKKEIFVVDDQFRTPTLAEDLADGCIKILLMEKEGIFNISGKDFLSVFQMVQKVAEFYDLSMDNVKKVSSSTLNQRAKRPPITGFVIDKAVRELGYDPVSFSEGIQIIDFQLASL
jgi:dTDP-4-dehydrorhamnose reductase